MAYDILDETYATDVCAKPTSPLMERRRTSMSKLIAKTPKQLDICLRLLYAEKVKFIVEVTETARKKIVYKIGISEQDEQKALELEEKYRILIS